jgi:Flp pilus assembly pilin Flp
MFETFRSIFKDDAGFTAIEYSLIATLSFITMAQLAQLLLLRSVVD